MAAQIVSAFPWSKVPWKELLVFVPKLIESAGKLRSKSSAATRAPPIPASDSSTQKIEAVIARLEALESFEAEQAVLVRDVTEQLQRASLGLAVLAKRTTLAVVFAATSGLISVVCLALLLFH
ncbi:hypothetical protein [Xanthomonas hortorum]|uniref:hypothetical protein n=1 Tax=Xanthomonas hortorum TaxID=56454 RepID=UPI0015D5BC7F|nr:hypothetical protein [Xanthomonas hortorum]MCE4359639.1 hypothetical protein [Xanthomonas hortorum pv. taraxaci]NMI53170.1 hypothetical protein [Xanthomonas hortorum pv. taraxaci]